MTSESAETLDVASAALFFSALSLVRSLVCISSGWCVEVSKIIHRLAHP